ncbi:DNA independent RNA polymerase I transcription factor [Ophidiomyces ophidiicola]|nr:DNA independent RNA polymerase I transcription factor [Ophidiomyces ophidiicola]KAI2042582.1 DNA independent RNA polymerase I transcription factor [Ophidiomyces ophidiicola]KAI2075019.1 DNA independent RNA polymerase I transcription factor [Ophidiomyces ophidiicola]KAI2076674.1 DNA independent RNA polymerase I transcription factor [Ophidiomyces ophidiicola]KAI2093920.1 DNA independent RNA polymerase I transcription factor [Ophidiomyces ophidiicola]
MAKFSSTSRTTLPTPPLPIPSKSILKTRTTCGQKRKIDMSLASEISTASDSCSWLPSNKKRARVTFEIDTPDSDNKIKADCGGVESRCNEKSTTLVREEVRRVIQRHLAGDSEGYDRLKELFSVDPKVLEENGSPVYDLPTHTSLKNHLLGLWSNVSALDGTCSGLVHAVLTSEWLGRDEAYVRLYVRFLGTLAAARGGYLTAVLKMLANKLHHVPSGTGRLPGYPIVRNSEIYDRTHLAIQYIVHLIPAGSVTLSPILSSTFPHDTDTAKSHIAFTRNLIKLIDYAPELRSDVLALITDKLVKLDVQIQVDLDDFEDEYGDEEKLHDEITAERFALEEEEDDDDDVAESVTSDEDATNIEIQRYKTVKDNINKIDYMLDLLFEYYSGPFNHGSVDDKESTLDLLLSHFQKIILPTYRSRHSQFLLFHYSQSSPVLIDRFAAACIQIIFSKSHPPALRQNAAAYLASFVARGAHVSSEVVRDVFDLLCTHLRNLVVEYEPTCRGPDLRRYATFYATTQAVLYIFCFRWRDLTTAAQEENFTNHNELDLDQVHFPPNISDVLHATIHSKLNPLKICSPSIVREFSRIAHHVGFMYVFPLLETNKRIRIFSFNTICMDSRFGQMEREALSNNDLGPQLDTYFPFDPYNLPRSRRWLEGDYVEWRGVPGLRNEDGDGDDTDDRDVEDAEIGHATETDEDEIGC